MAEPSKHEVTIDCAKGLVNPGELAHVRPGDTVEFKAQDRKDATLIIPVENKERIFAERIHYLDRENEWTLQLTVESDVPEGTHDYGVYCNDLHDFANGVFESGNTAPHMIIEPPE